jgi:hypothetical protein
MKKTLLALAAVAALAGGSAAAQAKVHFNVYVNPGYPVYSPYYEETGYYKPVCRYVKVKVVSYDSYGYEIVRYKTKKVCKKVYYNSY